MPTALQPVTNGTSCTWTGALNANGSLTYTFAIACNRNTGSVELTLNQAVMTGLSALATPGNAAYATITAQGTFAAPMRVDSDNSPIPVLSLVSENTYEFSELPLSPPLTINLPAGGSTPGTQFDNGSGGVSAAGFLGTIRVRARQDLDAATGQPLTTRSNGYAQRDGFGRFLLDYPGLSHRKPGEPSGLLCLACPRRRRRRDKFDIHCDQLQSTSPNGIPEPDYHLGGVHHQWCDRRRGSRCRFR